MKLHILGVWQNARTFISQLSVCVVVCTRVDGVQ